MAVANRCCGGFSGEESPIFNGETHGVSCEDVPNKTVIQ